VTFAGRLTDDELVDLYQRAWVVASASSHEGWGMTLTEAAACGTPAVATRIAGHLDAVADRTSGLLADDEREFVAHLDRLLDDDTFRADLGRGALAHAERFTWGATALGTLSVLAAEAKRARARR
jgi:glycosyltransferase involved in cell wall biosynthesis